MTWSRAAALFAALLVTSAAAARPPRIAVLVGANRASGRQTLHHAHTDARRVGAALVEVADFSRDEVKLLLDPAPSEVLAVLDRSVSELAGQDGAVLLFYYSGHASERAVLAGDGELSFAQLRARLDDPRVALRIGIIDACRGGGWTRTKGLSVDQPFEIEFPLTSTNQGSALMASSSGLENAHESEALQGSFFTHHLVAALRGAADEGGDGEVSLSEAFSYSRERTIRDTATFSQTPQHPSFELNLRGRQDLVLSRPGRGASRLTLVQHTGPLQVLQLETGVLLIELRPGQQRVAVALPGGKYLIRRLGPDGIASKEVRLPSTGAMEVREGELKVLSDDVLGLKGEQLVPLGLRGGPAAGEVVAWGGLGLISIDVSASDSVSACAMEAVCSPRLWVGVPSTEVFFPQLGVGPRQAPVFGLVLGAEVGLTDRLAWSIGTGQFTWRLGEPEAIEALISGGISRWAVGVQTLHGSSFAFELEVRAAVRFALKSWSALTLHAAATAKGLVASAGWVPFDGVRIVGGVTYSHTFGNRVTFHLGASLGALVKLLGAPSPRVLLGSVLQLGARPLPLVQVHLNPAWTFDVHAGLMVQQGSAELTGHLMLGVTHVF